MNYSVDYEPEALADLTRLSQEVQDRVVKKINWLAENFEQIKAEPLKGNMAGTYKLRIGDYRVVYEFSREERSLFIERIGHRIDIYD